MKKILLGVFLSSFLYSYIQSLAFPKKTTESFIIYYLEDKRIVPVRVQLNIVQQTEYVLSSRGGETLYDFSQGKVAYKDTNSSQCFIADITEESLEGDRKRLRNLGNGIVRGFYLPTFIIQEEFINGTKLLEKFGDRLNEFCEGNMVSYVTRQQHRRKRDTSDEKGQFTHHSYGHYGHQSNQYAHYGHETHITGSVDKDGQIKNQRVSHQQVRSESSPGYPGQSSRNGPQVSTSDERTGITGPMSQMQYQMPTYQQTAGGNGRNFGTGASGQFALQTAHESGYQLNLPLGLKAGNAYRGGIRSAGQYGVGGTEPQITTEYQRYPGSAAYRPGYQASLGQTSPEVPLMPGIPYPSGVTSDDQTARHRTALPGRHDLDQTLSHKLPGTPGLDVGKLPTFTHPIPPTTTDERRVGTPTLRGTETSDIRTDSRYFIPSGQRQPGADLNSRDTKYVDQRISNGHRIPQRIDHSGLPTSSLYPGPGISLPRVQTPVFPPDSRVQSPLDLSGVTAPGTRISGPGIQTPIFQDGSRVQTPVDLTGVTAPGTSILGPGIQMPSFHPGISMPSIHRPGSLIPSGIDSSGTRPISMRPTTEISTPGHQIPGIHPDSRQQYPIQGIHPDSRQQHQIPGIHPDSKQQHQIPDIYPDSRQQHQIPRIHPDSRQQYPIQGIHPDSRQQHQIPGIHPDSRQQHQIPGIYPDSRQQHQIPRIHPDSRQQYPIQGIHPDSRQQYQHPSRATPGQQFLQPPGTTHSGDHGINGETAARTQFPALYPHATIPGHPSPDRPGLTQASQPVSTHSTIPGTARYDQTVTNGIRYPGSPYQPQTQRGVREEYPGVGISPRILGDTRGIPITGVRPGDTQVLQRGTGPVSHEHTTGYQIPTLRQSETAPQPSTRDTRIPSRETAPGLITPSGRRIVTDHTGHESSRLVGQDSAASQTQIQTGIEGTAAEASAAGQYRGLGSQTQVQGGYAGNGSFSAQAQSGFTGGVVQSQVQGSKLGGLSGSSAQVERVGSAQSQVQVGQPSGAASSSAQGRFSGGTTQVQAQSGKTGGSAGAQAQSTGLSSSHVQVNIGGNDVSEREKFQGTVSASVQGGHSSGQSQTQLQGGYESGRTYVATAQGGFDSASGFQVSAPLVGSLSGLSNRTVGIQPSSAMSSQGPLHTVAGRPAVDSLTFRMPTGSGLDEKQTSQTTDLSSRDRTGQTIHGQPPITQPDQRHLDSRKSPQQQLPAGAIPQHTLYPPTLHTQGSRVQYPTLTSDTQRPSQGLPSSDTAGYPYPGYPTDAAGIPNGAWDGKQISRGSDILGYRGYEQSRSLPTELSPGTPQTSRQESPGYQVGAMGPSTYLPVTPQTGGQEISQHIPGLKPQGPRDISYPSSVTPSRRTTDQQYSHTPGIPVGYPDFSRQQPAASIFPQTPYSPTLESRHIPSYPTGLVPHLQRPGLATDQTGFRPGSLPGFQTEHYPLSSHFPGQPQISPPGPQKVPSHTRFGEIPGLTRPDETPNFGLQLPSSLGQPQIRQTLPQTVPSYRHPGEIPDLTRPDTTHFGLQPPSSPGQPQIRPQTVPSYPRPGEIPDLARPDGTTHFGRQPPSSLGQTQFRPTQPPPTAYTPRMPTRSETTDIAHTGRPGVSEPDESNCCEALRDLKRRCCGGSSTKNGASSCCKSAKRDETFDFSSEDDVDDSKGDEPCKIVKAICYIVYKPVGKARVCKPTQTNGC